MKSAKNRDLAKDLVDFLLNEEEQGKGSPKSSESKKTQDDPEDMPTNHAAINPPLEFDLDLGDGTVPDVNFESRKSLPSLPNAAPKKNEKLKSPKAKAVVEPPDEPTYSPPQLDEAPANATVRIDSNALMKKITAEEMKISSLPTSDHMSNTGRGKVIFSEVNNLVGGVEAIRVAQARITTLEKDRDQFRDEAEKLLSATEIYQRQVSELRALLDTTERKQREKVEILEEEKVVLKSRLNARESEIVLLKKSVEDFQSRFQNDLRKVRVRERELENRYELLKVEEVAIVHAKDEIILELKKQLEQLHFEIENFRVKFADMNNKISDFYDRNHRTVKAIRLALNVLESGDSDDPKKATG